MESLSSQVQNVVSIPFRYVFHLLLCDMPAKAAALNMMQFNGFNGCTHCLLIGERLGSRLVYPCDSGLKISPLRISTNMLERPNQKENLLPE